MTRASAVRLAKKSFGVVILDEAHKARASRGMQGRDPTEAEQSARFPQRGGAQRQNVILGTATPIQLDAVELWDLLPRSTKAHRRCSARLSTVANGLREESIRFLTGERRLADRTTPTAGVCFAIRCHLPSSIPCSATFATTRA